MNNENTDSFKATISALGGGRGDSLPSSYDWRSPLPLRSSRPQVTVNRQMGEINSGLRMGGKSQAWDEQSKALPRLTRGLGGEHQKSRRRRLSQDASCSDEMGRRNLKIKEIPFQKKLLHLPSEHSAPRQDGKYLLKYFYGILERLKVQSLR